MLNSKISLKERSIIVIDDNELIRNTLKGMFEGEGATAYTTGNIEKGLNILEGLVTNGTPPELIILDIRLQGCYGLQPLQGIKEILNGKRVPIVVASRGFNSIATGRMRLYGVLGYVEKPVLTDDLFKFSLGLLGEYGNRNTLSLVQGKKGA